MTIKITTKVDEFIKRYQYLTGDEFVSKEELEFFHFHKASNSSEQVLLDYLNLIQEKCREKWSTFNLNYCVSGLILIFLSIASLLVFLNYLNDSKYTDDATLANLSASLAKSYIIILCAYIVVLYVFDFKLSSSIGICALLFNLNVLFKFKDYFLRVRSLVDFFKAHVVRKDYVVVYLAFLIPFSNSFVIRENNTLRFLLVTTLFLDLYTKLCISKLNLAALLHKLKYLAVILFLLRVSFIFHVCREEVLTTLNCTHTIFSTQLGKISFLDTNSNASDKLSYFDLNDPTCFYMLFLIFNFACVFFIFHTVSTSNLKISLLNLTIKHLFYAKLCILFVYMSIQLKINVNSSSVGTAEALREKSEHLKSINILLARLVYVLFLAIQWVIWRPSKTALKHAKQIEHLHEERLRNLILSIGLLITLVMGESFLSVWILIFVIILYVEYLGSWSNGIISQLRNLGSKSDFFKP